MCWKKREKVYFWRLWWGAFTERAYAASLRCREGMEVGFMTFCSKHTVGLKKVRFKMNCKESVIGMILVTGGEGDSLETWPSEVIHI